MRKEGFHGRKEDCLDSTYEGLKQERLGAAWRGVVCLDSTYEGLKLAPCA